MKRRFDWRSRLHAALADFHARPFVWGESDCTSFVDSCVDAMTGESVKATLAFPVYTDVKGAIAALASLDCPDMQTLLAKHFESVAPPFAWEGDIALMDGPLTGGALGIVTGERIACVSESGYATIPRSRMKAAFRVPT